MARVTEINSLEELAGRRLLWDLLLSQTREATFFQSLDWLLAYWRHFGQRQRLRVLIVEAADRPIGILPLTVIPESTRLGTVRVLTYPLDGWGTFFGPIGPNPTATLVAGLWHVQATPQDWDLVDLRWIDARGIDAGRTAAALRSADLPAAQKPWQEVAQIELAGDWHSYWHSRDPDWRREIERTRRRLGERGELNFIRYRPEGGRCGDGDPRWDLYDTCEELARRSWQGSATDGTTLSHEGVRAYLRDAHAAAAAAGGVDLNLLLLDGQPLAFAYNYHYRGNIYGLRAGYDPRGLSPFPESAEDMGTVPFSPGSKQEAGGSGQSISKSQISKSPNPQSPIPSIKGAGNVLLRLMVEDSFHRGDYLLDLGPEAFDYKRRWATRVQPSFHYPHYAPTRLKAQALRAKRWLTRSPF